METHSDKFIAYLLDRIPKDNGFGAALRRADNPATEYQSWEYLASWCDIEKDFERRPYALIAAAVASAKPRIDGTLGVGSSIAFCFEDKQDSNSAKLKLRRLLACTDVLEACAVLRPILNLIESHSVPISYAQLLNDLIWFNPDKTRARWASDFYGRKEAL